MEEEMVFGECIHQIDIHCLLPVVKVVIVVGEVVSLLLADLNLVVLWDRTVVQTHEEDLVWVEVSKFGV